MWINNSRFMLQIIQYFAIKRQNCTKNTNCGNTIKTKIMDKIGYAFKIFKSIIKVLSGIIMIGQAPLPLYIYDS